jgi:hypothetical protein
VCFIFRPQHGEILVIEVGCVRDLCTLLSVTITENLTNMLIVNKVKESSQVTTAASMKFSLLGYSAV